jgi:2-oxoglutarate ferredoxin oxidoreductase subunit delta
MTADSAPSTDEAPEAAQPTKKARGLVWIDNERCKGCGFCIEFCPLHVLAMSAKFNEKGYHYPEMVAADKCVACDLCGMYCPDFAIHASRGSDADSTKE